MNKLNDWISFIFGIITGIYVYCIYGYDWKYWVTVIFIAFLTVSYHEIKKHLDSKDSKEE